MGSKRPAKITSRAASDGHNSTNEAFPSSAARIPSREYVTGVNRAMNCSQRGSTETGYIIPPTTEKPRLLPSLPDSLFSKRAGNWRSEFPVRRTPEPKPRESAALPASWHCPREIQTTPRPIRDKLVCAATSVRMDTDWTPPESRAEKSASPVDFPSVPFWPRALQTFIEGMQRDSQVVKERQTHKYKRKIISPLRKRLLKLRAVHKSRKKIKTGGAKQRVKKARERMRPGNSARRRGRAGTALPIFAAWTGLRKFPSLRFPRGAKGHFFQGLFQGISA